MRTKKVRRKAHIGVDVPGLPHAVMVTAANLTDRDGAFGMADYYRDVTDNLSLLRTIMADGGYTGGKFAMEIYSICGARVEIAKRSELHKFSVVPKRRIVGRTFGWLDKCRRLWKNCERKLQNTFQMVTTTFIRLLLKRY